MAIRQLPSNNWPGGERPASAVPLPESLTAGGETDSAGFSWEGRNFDHHGSAFANDDGETPKELLRRTQEIRQSVADLRKDNDSVLQAKALKNLATKHAETLVALSQSRVLIPLIAEAGDYGKTDTGKIVEKTQELSIVQVAAPDGRKVLLAFSSVQKMLDWNPVARPIPVPAVQVAIAAAQEGSDLVLIDAGNKETEFVVRRTELESLALGKSKLPAWAEESTEKLFRETLHELHEENVESIALAPGDPEASLKGPEIIVGIKIKKGLDKTELKRIANRLKDAFAGHDEIAHRVDSLALQLY